MLTQSGGVKRLGTLTASETGFVISLSSIFATNAENTLANYTTYGIYCKFWIIRCNFFPGFKPCDLFADFSDSN